MNTAQTFLAIRRWGDSKKLHDPNRQLIKLMEEVGELAEAQLKNDKDSIKDEIGDCVVVLTILAAQNGILIEEAIASAYRKISLRTGETVDGVFVKDEDIKVRPQGNIKDQQAVTPKEVSDEMDRVFGIMTESDTLGVMQSLNTSEE